nr:hypothetical protein [uncultured Cohaesibacter sp.]
MTEVLKIQMQTVKFDTFVRKDDGSCVCRPALAILQNMDTREIASWVVLGLNDKDEDTDLIMESPVFDQCLPVELYTDGGLLVEPEEELVSTGTRMMWRSASNRSPAALAERMFLKLCADIDRILIGGRIYSAEEFRAFVSGWIYAFNSHLKDGDC